MDEFPRLMTQEELNRSIGYISISQTCDAEYCSRRAEYVFLMPPQGHNLAMVCGKHSHKILCSEPVVMRFDYLKEDK